MLADIYQLQSFIRVQISIGEVDNDEGAVSKPEGLRIRRIFRAPRVKKLKSWLLYSDTYGEISDTYRLQVGGLQVRTTRGAAHTGLRRVSPWYPPLQLV
jgi:hypothetical protein